MGGEGEGEMGERVVNRDAIDGWLFLISMFDL